jgi:branched-chain amino acid transport system substrate-binding protein
MLLLFAACGPQAGGNTGSPSGSGSKIIKIGSDFPVSGLDTANGKPAQNGVQLAIKQANDKKMLGDYTLQFVPKDDVGPNGSYSPDVGKKNVTDLIGDALIAGIVGPFNSSVAEAEMPVTNQAPITLIAPSTTNQCLTRSGPEIGCTGADDKVSRLRPTGKVTFFRVAATDDLQGLAMAKFLMGKGYKKAYVIDDTSTYGKGLADVFAREWTKAGGQLVGNRESKQPSNDYGSTVANIKQANPDVIFFGGTDSKGGTQLRRQVLNDPATRNIPFAGGDGLQNYAFASTIGAKGGPTFASQAKVNETVLPSAKQFIEDYNKEFGEAEYGSYSAAAYDCAMIVIQAIKRALDGGAVTPKDSNDTDGAKKFRQAVIDAMTKTNYDGVTGHHSFDQNGDTSNKVISIWQIKESGGKGKYEFVDQLDASKAS